MIDRANQYLDDHFAISARASLCGSLSGADSKKPVAHATVEEASGTSIPAAEEAADGPTIETVQDLLYSLHALMETLDSAFQSDSCDVCRDAKLPGDPDDKDLSFNHRRNCFP